MRTTFHCEVAGLSYHWSNPIEGQFKGYIQAEPTNPKDPCAIAVYLEDGKMIGYIPSETTQALRIWSSGATDMPVSIKVWEDNLYSYASLTIINEHAETSSIVNGKKMVLSGEFRFVPIDSVKSVLSSYGAIIRSKVINRKTDLVVFESSIDTNALELQHDPEYHFEIICLWDLMKKIIADFPKNEFYGKRVSVWYNRLPENTLTNEYLLTEFLFESGAILGKYSKKETDIVIDERQYQRKSSQEAEVAEKQVRFIEDIFKEYRNVDITKPQKAKPIKDTVVIKLETSPDIVSVSRGNNSKKGCLSVLLLLVIPSALWLMLSFL